MFSAKVSLIWRCVANASRWIQEAVHTRRKAWSWSNRSFFQTCAPSSLPFPKPLSKRLRKHPASRLTVLASLQLKDKTNSTSPCKRAGEPLVDLLDPFR